MDLIAIYMTGLATLLLLLVPSVPGLRDIPSWIPVHRLIWRSWNQADGPSTTAPPAEKMTPAASDPSVPVAPSSPAGRAVRYVR